ncbi:MAG: HD-GYP domain-containing protein [Rhodoferax sp.]|uniref:HD-GYP domain-containing protein n=1 Tax=Rhodoferax sp. TaxID=50421 RepID=UPI00262AAFE7|nr:HD-GYP domain-containing protein [Rhodoferax sp.]MDD2881451.1 HD-GYP domain-containing protein [Rhodoferax sp.]
MLKRIHVDQLQLGMHLKEFCGAWMDHPFWRTGFVLKDANDLALILASSIKEVWIDCSLGLDVPVGVMVVAQASEVDAPEPPAAASPVASPISRDIAPASAAKEMERAARICLESKAAVVSMFEEVRMGNAVDVGGARQLVEDISDSIARNPGAIISMARIKTADDYTYMHSVAVCAMMVSLAKQLGLDDAQTRACGMAGLLHDLGKVAMPTEVLNKPGKLTDAEFDIMKTHPTEGFKMLKGSPQVDAVALDVVLHHHEKMDGSGYPERLKGDEINLYAKMGAVCDVYDAITSNRPYKTGWDPAESLRKMAEWKGHFDPKVFQAFVKSMGIYPVGSLVRLTSGRIGVVTEQSGKSLTTPLVKVFYSTKSGLRIVPYVVDLSRSDSLEKIHQREDPDKWNFPDLNELWSGVLFPN